MVAMLSFGAAFTGPVPISAPKSSARSNRNFLTGLILANMTGVPDRTQSWALSDVLNFV